MVQEHHSGYACIYPTPATNADQAAQEILDRSRAYGPPTKFMFDGPTHFKNGFLRQLRKVLKYRHHFTLPYSIWSNGAIERLGKEILRPPRAMVSELQMRKDSWPALTPMIQSVINNSPSKQRSDIAPINGLTGIQPLPQISTFICSSDGKSMNITDALRERSINIGKNLKWMDKLHTVVQMSLQKHSHQKREQRSKGQPANLMEGHCVLVAKDDFSAGKKLCLRWRGPRRVFQVKNDMCI